MGHKWQLHVFSIILLKSLICGVCYIFKSILGHLDSILPRFLCCTTQKCEIVLKLKHDWREKEIFVVIKFDSDWLNTIILATIISIYLHPKQNYIIVFTNFINQDRTDEYFPTFQQDSL